MKKAIIYAVLFGVLEGIITFLVTTFLHWENTIVESVMFVLFLTLGYELGIWSEKKKNDKSNAKDSEEENR